MDNTVDEIKRRLDIVTFLQEYITLKPAGRNFKANCPFHSEKTASFVVSPERQIWHCFGSCQEGGDVFKFIMKIEGITFSEAVKELARKTGVQLNNFAVEDKEWKKKEKLFEINDLATKFYHYILKTHKVGTTAKEYITNRGINDKIIDTFEIGYAPSSWDSLFSFLKKKKYDPVEIEKTGLILKSKKGDYYDRFRGRLMFPLKDHRGNTVGFSGRILQSGEKEAKYVNSPETTIYHKRETLFGLHMTKDNIRKANAVIIVEGEFDMLSLYQHGIDNVVAVKGSAVTIEQLRLLKRYTNKIIFALDSDASGEETIRRTIKEADLLEFELYVARTDQGKDPDEAVRNNLLAFKKLVQKPQPVYDFLLEATQKKYPEKDAFSKKKVAEEMAPFIVGISNPIVRDYYIKQISTLLDVDETSVKELLRKTELNQVTSNFKKPTEVKKQESNRYEQLQKYTLSLLFQDENPFAFYKKILTIIEVKDFSIPVYQKLFEHFLLYQNSIVHEGKFDITSFVNNLPSEIVATFDELLLFDISKIEAIEEKNVAKIVYEFKKMSLKTQIKKCIQTDQNEELPIITKQLSDIEKKLQIL